MITIIRTKSEWENVKDTLDPMVCAACQEIIGLADLPEIVQVESGDTYFFMHRKCALNFSGQVLHKMKQLTGECGTA